MRASVPDRHGPFGRDTDWPFAIRHQLLADLLVFILSPKSSHPKLLSLNGPSGSGKSFLARELCAAWANSSENALALYVDSPPAEFEAAAIETALSTLLSRKRLASRRSPSAVPAAMSQRWRQARIGAPSRKASYGYRVGRDLIGQIPVAGPFISAVLPEGLPDRAQESGPRALQFAIRQSHSRPVLLAFDNIQNIPPLVRDAMESEFQGAGGRLRILIIEQCESSPEVEWLRSIERLEVRTEALGASTQNEIARLVEVALPGAPDREDLANAIQRRSNGNLKSAWFQLKMIAERRSSQAGEGHDAYEQAIQTLGPLDTEVLRFAVFLLGGFTVPQFTQLLQAAGLHVTNSDVGSAVRDMTTLGLLIINSERHDKVRVEHELVARTVRALTAEEEKLELRIQLLRALSTVLESKDRNKELPALYDRLVGIADETDIRANPRLLTHLVEFIRLNHDDERYTYLCGMFRDSVCWNVVELLPEHSVRLLLIAVQRCSLFEFGLIAVQRLALRNAHRDVASLFEAKFLVQLFRYEEATNALSKAPASKEKRSVEFNIMLNLCQDEEAARIADQVFRQLSETSPSEHDYLILRNSGHLFKPDKARRMLTAAVAGFQDMGLRFGLASAIGNRGIVDLVDGALPDARAQFERAQSMLADLHSDEVYQPLVNLAGAAFAERDWASGARLLEKARKFAPSSLAMDDVMLDFNAAILRLATAGLVEPQDVAHFRNLHVFASKTKDLRFIKIVGWFASNVTAVEQGQSEAGRAALESKIETKGRAAIELFQELRLGDRFLTLPFILSPHWRY